MSSGVTLDDECLVKFQELKLGKKLKYIIYKLNKENTKIVVEKASLGGDYEDFMEDLPPKQCCWGVFDLEYRKDVPDGEPVVKQNKLVFFSWSPDDAKIKDKMVSASSKDALRRALVGIQIDVQASEYSDVAKEAVVAKAKRGN
ncbi:actin depolymerizing factor [Lactarius tabidus]|jgi:cofilin